MKHTRGLQSESHFLKQCYASPTHHLSNMPHPHTTHSHTTSQTCLTHTPHTHTPPLKHASPTHHTLTHHLSNMPHPHTTHPTFRALLLTLLWSLLVFMVYKVITAETDYQEYDPFEILNIDPVCKLCFSVRWSCVQY